MVGKQNTEPRVGDVWMHLTMPEKIEVIKVTWSDGIRWVEVDCASGCRHMDEHEWHAWAKNAERRPPRTIRNGPTKR
jgi:hypothetical protein